MVSESSYQVPVQSRIALAAERSIMTLQRRQFLQLAAAATLTRRLVIVACVAGVPDAPVRVIVPFAPGGPNAFSRASPRRSSPSALAAVLVENIGGPRQHSHGTRCEGSPGWTIPCWSYLLTLL